MTAKHTTPVLMSDDIRWTIEVSGIKPIRCAYRSGSFVVEQLKRTRWSFLNVTRTSEAAMRETIDDLFPKKRSAPHPQPADAFDTYQSDENPQMAAMFGDDE
jgi:hypothetical protein